MMMITSYSDCEEYHIGFLPFEIVEYADNHVGVCGLFEPVTNNATQTTED